MAPIPTELTLPEAVALLRAARGDGAEEGEEGRQEGHEEGDQEDRAEDDEEGREEDDEEDGRKKPAARHRTDRSYAGRTANRLNRT